VASRITPRSQQTVNNWFKYAHIADYERGANSPELARLNAQIIRIWAARTAEPIGRAQAHVGNASAPSPEPSRLAIFGR
jgi:hypothetical protein